MIDITDINELEIFIPFHQVFSVSLPENPSKGFTWHFDQYDPSIVQMIAFRVEKLDEEDKSGLFFTGPQKNTWTFFASKTGPTTMVFRLKKPELPNHQDDPTISYEVIVTTDTHVSTKNKQDKMQTTIQLPPATPQGLKVERMFTKEGEDVYKTCEWRTTDVAIKEPDGTIVFEQKDVSVPEHFSETAAKIVASKYFRGHVGQPGRETSVKQMIERVAHTISAWGCGNGKAKTTYFSSVQDALAFQDELRYILLHQFAAFNSPVWFNVGVNGYEPTAVSACYINSIEDNMDSILELYKTEGKLFSDGSGSGINLSKLRAKGEPLSTTGSSSGPLSFDRGWDRSAGAVKSGGSCLAPYQLVYTDNGPVRIDELTTREKFVVLSYDPPAKRYKAKWAKSWKSGHKMVYRITTDKGSFDVSGDHPIKLSTGEYVKAINLTPGMSLFACTIDMHNGYLRVGLRDGKKGKEKFHRLIAKDVLNWNLKGKHIHHKDGNKTNNNTQNLDLLIPRDHHLHHNMELLKNNSHPFQLNDFSHAGQNNGMHKDRNFWKDENKVKNYIKKQSEILLSDKDRTREMQRISTDQRMMNIAFKILNNGGKIDTFNDYIEGRKKYVGRIPSITQVNNLINERFGSYDNFVSAISASNHRVVSVEAISEMDVYDIEVDCPTADNHDINSGHNFVLWPNSDITGSGIAVSNTRRSARMVLMDVSHPDVREFINCKAVEEKKAHALIDAGYSGAFNVEGGAYDTVAFQNANHSVRLTDEFMEAAIHSEPWETKYVVSGQTANTYNAKDLLMELAEATHFCGDPGAQFSTTINNWHTCKNSGEINASNPCCLVYDTLIDIVGENPMTIGSLFEMRPSDRPMVKCVDDRTYRPRIRPIKHVWLAGYTNNLVQLTLSNGAIIKCTPDHPILTVYNGIEYINAEDSEGSTLILSATGEYNRPRILSQESLIHGRHYTPLVTVLSVLHLHSEKAMPVYDMEIEEHHNFGVIGTRDEQGMVVNNEHTGKGVIVSNSEYLFLDDTACNLASLNLMKFRSCDTSFNTSEYKHVARIMITAMEIMVDNASYPTEKITQRSHEFRTLGLGYSNLGALLMSNGLAYDSEDARIYASLLTSILTGEAYHQSAQIAKCCGGPFPGYEVNREPMLDVIKMHWTEHDNLSKLIPDSKKNATDYGVWSLWQEGQESWSDCYNVGFSYGYRNAQSTVQAPTGTISFLMDCATTGIEPDIALVKYKTLVGGGFMKLVNENVPDALITLGYSETEIDGILTYIEEYDTIERCPLLRPYHISVFDCAFQPTNGERSIAPGGHLKMLAAIQPFISGSSSKTVNVPNSATVEDIYKMYIDAWQMGIKCVAIYRDGCKRTQPLNTKKQEPVGSKEDAALLHTKSIHEEIPVTADLKELLTPAPNLMTPESLKYLDDLVEKMKNTSTTGQKSTKLIYPNQNHRRKLPDERNSITHKFSVAGHEGYIIVGLYEDGTPGEMFLRISKEGSTLSGMMDAFATAVSLGLQFSVPLTTFINKFKHTRFEPSGYTSNEQIRIAKSIIDYVFRWMELKFLGPQEEIVPEDNLQASNDVEETYDNHDWLDEYEKETFVNQSDSPMCTECGSLTYRKGSCYYCDNCGTSNGCS